MKKLQRNNPIGPPWLRCALFALCALTAGWVIARNVLQMGFADAAALEAWTAERPAMLTLTALLCALAVFVVGTVLGRLWLSTLLVGTAGMVLALVDYFKTAINGEPLTLADFGLITQLGEVAGVAGDLTPPPVFWDLLGQILVLCAVLLGMQRLLCPAGRTRFLAATVSLALLVALFTPAFARSAGEAFGMDMYARLPVASNHYFHGLPLSLWRDSVIQTIKEPKGYSEESMRRVLARIDELLAEENTEPVENVVQPNVIMVLSESFFDLTRLPDLTYERDPLENFHALEKESVSGSFFSHYMGYGTGYLEMAMQYGVDNHDFAPGTNICFMEDGSYQLFDALPEQLTKNGPYRAEMLHAYNDSLYNRTVTYPLLGYSQLLFSADMQALGLDWSGSVYGGYYLKDAYTYRAALERMRAINEGGEQAFLYLITMENHQPFDAEKFGYQCQIGVESEVLSEEDMAIARVMVEGMTRADQALGELVEALRQSEEPTVVVFFGDHRPNLLMPDGETIYTHYGLSPSNDTSTWTAEQIADLYSTDYLIWANDAALLQGRAGERTDSSITAIGPQLLELLGVKPSRYWALLQKVSEAALMDADLYFVDGESRVFRAAEAAELTPQQQELLELRQAVVYDAFYGQRYITAEMNLPAGG